MEKKTRYLVMVTPDNHNKFYKQIPVDDYTWIAEYGRIGNSSTKRTYSMSVWESKYREKLRKDGKICWVNTIVYDYRAVLAAKHSDDTALAGDPDFGWGWCADNFEIIQTDWVLALSDYLEKSGKRYR